MRLVFFAAVWIRALLFIPVLAVATVALGLPCIAAGLLNWHGVATLIVRTWCRLILRWFSVHVTLRGSENLPASDQTGVMVVFNHQSHFDIPALFDVLKLHLRFGAKIELFKIPIFGHAMRATRMLPIARGDRETVFRVYRESARHFADGLSIVLAPEGTRQARPEIGAFKKGPFIFAKEAGATLVPVVIAGAFWVMPKSAPLPGLLRWRFNVIVEALEPVQPSPAHDPDAQAKIVRERMQDAFARLSFALNALQVQANS